MIRRVVIEFDDGDASDKDRVAREVWEISLFAYLGSCLCPSTGYKDIVSEGFDSNDWNCAATFFFSFLVLWIA